MEVSPHVERPGTESPPSTGDLCMRNKPSIVTSLYNLEVVCYCPKTQPTLAMQQNFLLLPRWFSIFLKHISWRIIQLSMISQNPDCSILFESMRNKCEKELLNYIIQRIIMNYSMIGQLHWLSLVCQSSGEESVLPSSWRRKEVK